MLSKIKTLSILVISLFFIGCTATVEMDTDDADTSAKLFKNPQNGKVGLYLYRNEFYDPGLTRALWIDGEYLGETAPYVYFYTEVEPGKHIISTQSEFGENHVGLDLKSNKNVYIHQEMKLGVFSARTRLIVKSAADGQKDILESCKKAKNQTGKSGMIYLDQVPHQFDEIFEKHFVSEPTLP